MGNLHTKLRNVRLRIAPKIAEIFGYTVTFSHRGGTTYTLYARFVLSGSEQVDEAGRVYEARYLDLALPIQTNFPDPGNTDDEAVIQGDVVGYRGRTYQVVGEIKRDDKDATYHFRAYEHKALGIGTSN